MLQYDHLDIFKNHYAQGDVESNVLEEELRMVCDLMGLHFLKNQDFYSGCVSFDEESTTFLKNRGFHISEEYCLSLMKLSPSLPFFKDSEKQPSPMPEEKGLESTLNI